MLFRSPPISALGALSARQGTGLALATLPWSGGVLLGLAAVGWVPTFQPAGACSLWPQSDHRRDRPSHCPQQRPPPPRLQSAASSSRPSTARGLSLSPALPGVKGWSDCLWSGKGVGAFLQVKAWGWGWGCGGGWGWGGAGGRGQFGGSWGVPAVGHSLWLLQRPQRLGPALRPQLGRLLLAALFCLGPGVYSPVRYVCAGGAGGPPGCCGE